MSEENKSFPSHHEDSTEEVNPQKEIKNVEQSSAFENFSTNAVQRHRPHESILENKVNNSPSVDSGLFSSEQSLKPAKSVETQTSPRVGDIGLAAEPETQAQFKDSDIFSTEEVDSPHQFVLSIDNDITLKECKIKNIFVEDTFLSQSSPLDTNLSPSDTDFKANRTEGEDSSRLSFPNVRTPNSSEILETHPAVSKPASISDNPILKFCNTTEIQKANSESATETYNSDLNVANSSVFLPNKSNYYGNIVTNSSKNLNGADDLNANFWETTEVQFDKSISSNEMKINHNIAQEEAPSKRTVDTQNSFSERNTVGSNVNFLETASFQQAFKTVLENLESWKVSTRESTEALISERPQFLSKLEATSKIVSKDLETHEAWSGEGSIFKHIPSKEDSITSEAEKANSKERVKASETLQALPKTVSEYHSNESSDASSMTFPESSASQQDHSKYPPRRKKLTADCLPSWSGMTVQQARKGRGMYGTRPRNSESESPPESEQKITPAFARDLPEINVQNINRGIRGRRFQKLFPNAPPPYRSLTQRMYIERMTKVVDIRKEMKKKLKKKRPSRYGEAEDYLTSSSTEDEKSPKKSPPSSPELQFHLEL